MTAIEIPGLIGNEPIHVFVPGQPAPQGSVRAINHRSTGRAVVIKDNNATQKAWRSYVRDALIGPDGQPLRRFDEAVHVDLDFVMKRPLSTPKRRTPPATKKPDLDKLVRAVFDAITSAGVWPDDSYAVQLHSSKRLAELGEAPGCLIRIAGARWGFE